MAPTINQDKQGGVDRRVQGTTRVDPSSWVGEHGDALFRFAMLRIRNREMAEELVQECFVAALAARHRFTGAASERTWLISILKRKIVDHLRRKQNDPTAADASEFFNHRGLWLARLLPWKNDPADGIHRREFAALLRDCIEALPHRLGDVFLLRELDDHPSREICDMLDITESNLWQRLHRARLQLRQCLEANGFARPRPQRTGRQTKPARNDATRETRP